MPNGIDSRGNVPVSAKSLENIGFGLLDSKINALFVKQNLDNLITDIINAEGSLAQLGININQLKDVYGKIAVRNEKFGKEFPAAQMEALDKIIEQAEAKEAEQKAQDSTVNTEIGYTPDTITANEKATVRSTIDAYSAWRNIVSDDLLRNTGSKWNSVDIQISDHLSKLSELKNLQAYKDNKTEIDTITANAAALKEWHGRLPAQPIRTAA